MSAQSAHVGFGLYFIDVLACLLFCITLALVGARFGHERTVEVDLPTLESAQGAGSELEAPEIAVRSEAGSPRFYLDGDPVEMEELESRLRASTPPAVVVRAEDSALSRVIAAAHAAGVHDIQLAYALASGAANAGAESGPKGETQ